MTRISMGGVLVCLLLFAPGVGAVTQMWNLNTQPDYSAFKLNGISLTNRGGLAAAPQIRPVYDAERALIWGANSGRNQLFVFPGVGGKVVILNEQYQLQKSFDLGAENEVTASFYDQEAAALYIGTTPAGRVYRLTAAGAPELYFETQKEQIWAITKAFDDKLYLGAGADGEIFQLDGRLKGRVWAQVESGPVNSLLYSDEKLFVATAGKAHLYRCDAQGNTFLLFDGGAGDINCMQDYDDRYLVLSVNTTANAQMPSMMGAMLMQMGAAKPVGLAGSGAHLETGGESDLAPTVVEVKSGNGGNGSGAAMAAQKVALALAGKAKKSSVFLVDKKTGIFSRIWQRKGLLIQALAYFDDAVFIGTDSQAAIYKIYNDNQYEKVYQSETLGVISALRPLDSERMLAATAQSGWLLEVSAGDAASGEVLSPVIDSGNISQWGKIGYLASDHYDSRAEIYTRTGNANVPDDHWSAWELATNRHGSRSIVSPSARFIQWKIVCKKDPDFRVENVFLFWRQLNLAPVISGVRNYYGNRGPDKAVSVVRFGPQGPDSPQDKYPERGFMTTAWQSQDPNGDENEFYLYYRAFGESRWSEAGYVEREEQLVWDTRNLPDGNYHLKLVASDALDNDPGQELTSEYQSRPIRVDNNPPRIKIKSNLSRELLTVYAEVKDDTSVLAQTYYAIDGGIWLFVNPEDGIYDSRMERFVFEVDVGDLDTGRHSLVVLAFDVYGNQLSVPIGFEIE